MIGKEALKQQLYYYSPDMIVFLPHLIAPVIRRPHLQTPGFIEWRSQVKLKNYGTMQLRQYLCKIRAAQEISYPRTAWKCFKDSDVFTFDKPASTSKEGEHIYC